jgi:hypothetical protein
VTTPDTVATEEDVSDSPARPEQPAFGLDACEICGAAIAASSGTVKVDIRDEFVGSTYGYVSRERRIHVLHVWMQAPV